LPAAHHPPGPPSAPEAARPRVSFEDYESLKETAYLLRSPANARRLLASIDELESGGGAVRELATAE